MSPGITLNVDVDVDVYALTPMLIWVSDAELAGAHLGVYVAPYLGNTSLTASLSTATGLGLNIDSNQFAPGDIFVQPVWLGWTMEHFACGLSYGFYAPAGLYDTETITLPVVGPIRVESTDK